MCKQRAVSTMNAVSLGASIACAADNGIAVEISESVW
jgi:hypothetical protein